MWQQWLNGLLGLWVILASYIYIDGGAERTVLMITGLVVSVLGFWGAGAHSSSSSQMPHMQQR